MSKLKTVLRLLGKPGQMIRPLAQYGLINWMPDKTYAELVFRTVFGYPLDLENPKTFNEKLQWLKLNNRRPEYTEMADKYRVRSYIQEKIGDEYLIPLLGMWERVEDIDFDALPDRFVLKCNHDQGSVVICKEKASFDREKAKKKLAYKLSKNHYWPTREWPYRNIRPCILCEQYMEEKNGADLRDYKIHCFNGVPKFILVCSDRFSADGLREDFYDTQWNRMELHRPEHPNSQHGAKEPECLAEMLSLAEKLSQDIPFLRVDFYEISGKLYFGELTFYPASGFRRFAPEGWDAVLGSWLQLPGISHQPSAISHQ